jgi:succinate dehydrogenase / fumarate reductase cytochrome b subunit
MSAKTSKRPLSPHLQVYKPQMTSVMSILHRITGAGNTVGLLLFSWWLIAAASGTDAYADFIGFITSGFGMFLLFGWTASVCYHMCNGIRHLFWDSGYLFKIQNAYKAGYAVLAVAAILTLLIWIV